MTRLASCLESGTPFALYRLPGEEISLIDTLPGPLAQSKNFLFFPFRSDDQPEFRIENGYWSLISSEEISNCQYFLSDEPGQGSPENEKEMISETEKDKIKHIILINKALEELHSNTLSKVVLARKERRRLPGKFELVSYFRRLCEKYPTAFVYLTRLPDGNIWIGASPEILLEARSGTCRTVSLAGTRKINNGSSWTAKEIREQSIVSDYIRETLQRLGVRDVREEGPFEVEAGLLRHRKTVFRFQTEISAESLARALHPTPAVAGIPVEAAIEFIHRQEAESRSYYAGGIGPYDSLKADFYVNLRCASLFNSAMTLYAGGGILEGSDPEAEYEETLHKMQILWSVVENS